jgi:hypothetical protein
MAARGYWASLRERADATAEGVALRRVDPAPVDARFDDELCLAMVVDLLHVDRYGCGAG